MIEDPSKYVDEVFANVPLPKLKKEDLNACIWLFLRELGLKSIESLKQLKTFLNLAKSILQSKIALQYSLLGKIKISNFSSTLRLNAFEVAFKQLENISLPQLELMTNVKCIEIADLCSFVKDLQSRINTDISLLKSRIKMLENQTTAVLTDISYLQQMQRKIETIISAIDECIAGKVFK